LGNSIYWVTTNGRGSIGRTARFCDTDGSESATSSAALQAPWVEADATNEPVEVLVHFPTRTLRSLSGFGTIANYAPAVLVSESESSLKHCIA